MIGGVLSLDSRDHRWINALRNFGVSKVGIYDSRATNDSFLSTLISKVKREREINGKRILVDDPYFSGAQCLVSYTGFGFFPNGMLFRNLIDKEFRIADYADRNLRYYVSQRFEENISKFRYGTPIVLLEGVLDVECFVHTVGYPFVVGYLTSYVRELLSIFLSSLTDKFLVVPDNDGPVKVELNKKQLDSTMKNFSKCGITPTVFNTRYKDFGDVYLYNALVEIQAAKEALTNLIGGK